MLPERMETRSGLWQGALPHTRLLQEDMAIMPAWVWVSISTNHPTAHTKQKLGLQSQALGTRQHLPILVPVPSPCKLSGLPSLPRSQRVGHSSRKDGIGYLKVEVIVTSSSSAISKWLVAMRSSTCSSLPSFHKEMPGVSGLSSS